MTKMHFSITINAPKAKVWSTMLDDATCRVWTEAFTSGSHYVGDWSKGSKILFLGPDPITGKPGGMVSRIKGARFHNDFLDKGFVFAEEHFKKVSEKTGYSIPVPEDIINTFGYKELEKGNVQEAIEFFKRNIRQNPNSANAFDSIAEGYEKAGMWKEAIVSSEKAVELAKRYNSSNLGYFIEHARKIKNRNAVKSEKQN